MSLLLPGARVKQTRLINNILYYEKVMSEEEVVAEIIASYVGRSLGIDVVTNLLVDTNTIYSIQYYSSIYEVKVPLSYEYNISFDEVFLFDYIIINIDRHSENVEVLYNTKTGNYRLSSLFDFNLSLLSTVSDETLEIVSPFYNPITQNFNSKSLLENIEGIQPIYISKRKFKFEELLSLFGEYTDPYIEYRVQVLTDVINSRIDYLAKKGIII